MVDRTSAIKLVKQFLNDCINSGVSVTSAWMFGSYAKVSLLPQLAQASACDFFLEASASLLTIKLHKPFNNK